MTNDQHSPQNISIVQHLIESLKPEEVQLIETHISWLLLYGQTALKIKKPLKNPFLDYSTLDLRQAACTKEIQLNRRYSSNLYQSVVAIIQQQSTSVQNQLSILELPSGQSSNEPDRRKSPQDATGGPNVGQDAIYQDGKEYRIEEYAVKMQRFADDALLAHRLDQGLVEPSSIEQLAKTIADFHESATVSDRSHSWGSPSTIIQDAFDNFEFLMNCDLLQHPTLLAELHNWTTRASDQLTPTFEARQQSSRIRECHGDLHLENIIYWHDQLIPFDGIEFSEHLRWIDVQNDAAFTSMDLAFHGYQAYAHRFTNAYLEHGGDYQGLTVLRWYEVYRAMVRAKVCLLRAQQESDNKARVKDVAQATRFVELAHRLSQPRERQLFITYGLSGSGKTFGSQKIVDQRGAIRIRSDVERKRATNTNGLSTANNQTEPNNYSDQAKQTIYDQLLALAKQILTAGFSVIVDATFLRSENRNHFKRLADEFDVPFQILVFDADVETLEQRIRDRQKAGKDQSDADVDVLHQQLRDRDPLTSTEQQFITKT